MLRVVLLIIMAHFAPLIAAQEMDRPRDLVNPFIGTGGHGHTFPGACVPNGLVQLSPDTRPDPVEWDGCGGYHYSDSLIYGFSHTHLSGTGVADLCDVLVMPMSGRWSPDPQEYRSRFSHDREAAHAGYYRVHLDDEDVDAELTATARVGMHRYTFPQGKDAFLVLDLEHRDVLLGSSIVQVSDTEVVGERRSSSLARDQRLYFCMRFNHPVKTKPGQGNLTDQIEATTRSQDHFSFGDLGGEPLVVKVGISAVSIEGARRNLEAEVPGWDFDEVRQQAEAAWNAKLDKIQVEGGTREQQRIFYTALYHSYVAPYIFNDVDGQYRGMDGQVHHADHDVYTVFSLWDTFRALHPLMTILEPEMTNDFIRTMLLHYQDGGRLPVWELWGNETDCMIGYHSVSVIADAYLKGLRDYDADLALEAMVASAMGEDPCLEAYRKQGYISSEDCAESVSKTLEYAYDDWCIAQMAREMGRDSLAEVFHRRSGNWRNLFDPETKFFRARRNGGFIDPFDPYEVNFHFTEANAWQYSLFAPQAIDELAACMGGTDSLEAQLDRLFTASIATTGRDQADITGLIGQYAHGNEPSHHMAYLYSWLGKHDKARHYLDRILNELYQDGPAGLSGNEDCGQMSTWYVLSAMGMFPIAPGDGGRYDLGEPLFESIQVQVNDTTTWSMSATELEGLIGSKGKPMVRHESIMQGSKPGPIARGTVLDGAYLCTTAPVIVAPAASFSDALEVTAKGTGTCTITDASGTRPCPMNAPFTLTATSTVAVDWSEHYAPVTAHFTRFDSDLKITLDSEYANQYAAGGDGALIDGIRGGADFRTGAWQGYQGQDVTFTLDLGKVVTVDSVGLGMLQDMMAWIWYPEQVQVAWSTNRRQWSSTIVVPNVDRQLEGGMHMDLWTGPIGRKARFITITARNAGPCPDWHLGAGGDSWIFLDEVMVAHGR